MKPLVYLAGPISGLSYGGATDWREYAVRMLEPEVKGLSPMRNKQFLSHLSNISGTGEDYKHISPLATARGVMTRDRFDCTRCDVLLVNLLGAARVSIGTCMEIAWADLSRIPIVACMEADNVHRHMMVDEAIGYSVDSLDDGLAMVKAVLGV